jgi:hypothetical protein
MIVVCYARMIVACVLGLKNRLLAQAQISPYMACKYAACRVIPE